jgi:hypothetical protein
MSIDPSVPPAPPCSALLALARRAADAGAYQQVRDLFAAACAASMTAEDAARWQLLLLEAGDVEGAQEAARRSGAGAVAALATDDVSEGEDDGFLDFEPGERTPRNAAVPEPMVATFLRHFAGRADVYARQWHDARRDRSGYWPVREPLTAHVVEQHLLRRLTIGQYVLHPDNTVSFAALDLDPTAAALEQMRLPSGGEGALALPPLLDYAARVFAAADRLGLRVAMEDTGGFGLHVWLLFAPRIPAAQARGVLRELLWRAGPQPPAVSVELFPKQDRLGGKGLGNLIKLPLGVHQATLRPSRFLDAHMQALEDAHALASLRPCDPAAVEAVLASRVIPLRAAPADHPEGGEPAPPPLVPSVQPTPRALAEALAAIPPGPPATAAADRMLAGCAVLRELVRLAHEEHRLWPEAARTLVYTLGIVGRENPRIEEALCKAGVSRKEIQRVRRGLQAPIGCKRLRERFPAVAAHCACPLAPPGGYATPALFALRSVPSFKRSAPPWPAAPDLEAGDGDQAQPELQSRLARIEAALATLLDRQT